MNLSKEAVNYRLNWTGKTFIHILKSRVQQFYSQC